MKCPNCGATNSDEDAFCGSCGRDMMTALPQESQSRARNCPSCGRSIPWSANVCPYCGKDFRIQMYQAAQGPQLSTGIRILLYIMSLLIPIAGFIVGAIYYTKPDPEYKHVGKMCIVFGIVSIILTFGIAALLYVMVLGFGGVHIETPAATYSKISVIGGYRITILAITMLNIPWTDVRVHLTDGSNFAEWGPLATDLDDSPGITASYTARPLGTISVALNVTDLAGNGFVNGGDFFQVVSGPGFLSGVTYRAVLIFEPSGEQMGTGISFTS